MEELGICPNCGQTLIGQSGLLVFCSSHGNDLPWLTDEDIKNGLNYTTKYPNGCGYKFMSG